MGCICKGLKLFVNKKQAGAFLLGVVARATLLRLFACSVPLANYTRQGTSMLCDNCHTTIEQPSHNNRAAVAQLCDNCHTHSQAIMTIFHYHLGDWRSHIGEATTIYFPRVCIQELVQKWVQQIEHPKNQPRNNARKIRLIIKYVVYLRVQSNLPQNRVLIMHNML